MSTMKINFGPKFDWFDVLGKLNNGSRIDDMDKEILDEKAGSWPACACGQLCELLPRKKENNAPVDQKLQQLGIHFSEYVNCQQWDRAFKCLIKIEERSTELLQEMGIDVVLVEHPRKFKRAPKPDIPKVMNPKPFAARLAEHGAGFQRVSSRN